MKPTPRTLLYLSIGLTFLIALHTLAFAQDKPDFAALKGRWFRTDGDYVVEIQNVGADGQMQAAYYNPKPINVSRAEATRSDRRGGTSFARTRSAGGTAVQ